MNLTSLAVFFNIIYFHENFQDQSIYQLTNHDRALIKRSFSSSGPHFYFLVKPKSLDKSKENFENPPQNFYIVVHYVIVSKSKNRKHIIKFQERCNRNVAILLPSIRAYRLIDAEDPAKMSKLLKAVYKHFSEIVFSEYIEPSPELNIVALLWHG